MTTRVNIDLTAEEVRLLSTEGKTADGLLRERLGQVARKEVQDWWDSLTPAQKQAVYKANNP